MALFFRSFFYVLGIVSAVLTVLSSLDRNFSSYYSDCVIETYLITFTSILLISLFLIRERKSIFIKISDRVKLNVKYGDLLSEKGIIIIPVNDYFDVEVDDKIISKNTLHGKFIDKYFADDIEFLHLQIKNELRAFSGVEVPNRERGNTIRYPLGTIVKIQKDDQIFFLIAFTRFNENNRAQISNLEYQENTIKLIDFIENNSNGYQVNIPLIGSGHSGVRASKQQLLEFLIFALKIKDNLTLLNGVNIVIHPSLKEEISLKLVKYYYDVTT